MNRIYWWIDARFMDVIILICKGIEISGNWFLKTKLAKWIGDMFEKYLGNIQ